MDKNLLKKYFPLSFRKKPTTKELVIDILIYVAVALIAGAVIGVCAGIPVVKWFTGLAGAVVEIYVIAGGVLTFLDYKKLLK